MPILFSAVAYEKKILAKFASCDGNFTEIANEVLAKVPRKNDKMTFTHGPYLIHYIAEDDHFYFCITAKGCQRSRAFLFLNQMKRRFEPSDKDFISVLADEMYRYSEDYNTITIRKGELDELNSIGVESSETILGEKMLFVDNPENLTYSTTSSVRGPSLQKSVSSSTISENPQQILLSSSKISETSQQTPVSNTTISETPQQISIISSKISETAQQISISSSTTSETSQQISISSDRKIYLIIMFSVIFVLMWLAVSIFGSVSFVILACVFVLSLVRLSKTKNKTE